MAQSAGRDRVVGDYLVGRQIGSGSFSVVWHAKHRVHGTEVAIKEIATGRLNTKIQESLKSEICILRRINHPNIIRLHDIIEVSDFSFWNEFQVVDLHIQWLFTCLEFYWKKKSIIIILHFFPQLWRLQREIIIKLHANEFVMLKHVRWGMKNTVLLEAWHLHKSRVKWRRGLFMGLVKRKIYRTGARSWDVHLSSFCHVKVGISLSGDFKILME